MSNKLFPIRLVLRANRRRAEGIEPSYGSPVMRLSGINTVEQS